MKQNHTMRFDAIWYDLIHYETIKYMMILHDLIWLNSTWSDLARSISLPGPLKLLQDSQGIFIILKTGHRRVQLLQEFGWTLSGLFSATSDSQRSRYIYFDGPDMPLVHIHARYHEDTLICFFGDFRCWLIICWDIHWRLHLLEYRHEQLVPNYAIDWLGGSFTSHNEH